MPLLQFLLLILLVLQSFNSYGNETVFTLVSQNLHRFFDDKDDGNHEKVISRKKYQRRLERLVKKISTEYKFADVIALQEIENIAILNDISHTLKAKFDVEYHSILIEGNDVSGIDVGYLVNSKFQVKSITSLFKDTPNFTKTGRLFSRPPLLIKLCLSECLSIVNVHLRSMRGLKSTKKQKRISLKRRLQAETLARWINNFQTQQPAEKLIIVGDFNALTPSDAFVDSLGTIIGAPDQQRPKWTSPDLIKTDLINASRLVKANKRFSYNYKKKKQLLDYLLISKNSRRNLKAISYTSIDYKFSDHAALKAKIVIQ